jgi:hypothetical protein
MSITVIFVVGLAVTALVAAYIVIIVRMVSGESKR